MYAASVARLELLYCNTLEQAAKREVVSTENTTPEIGHETPSPIFQSLTTKDAGQESGHDALSGNPSLPWEKANRVKSEHQLVELRIHALWLRTLP